MNGLQTHELCSSDREWDVLVIGAGPAGALAARESALGGAKTLLVERKFFPRNKVCGACLNSSALEILNARGLGEMVHRLPGMPVREFQLRVGRQFVNFRLPEGRAIARSRLDMALAQAAVSAGAVFVSGTSATVGEIVNRNGDEFRSVQLSDSTGETTMSHARIVLAADGLGHTSLDAMPEFDSRVDRSSRIGLGAICTDFPAVYRAGTIFMGVGRSGYVGLVRVGPDELNVAAAVDSDFVRSSGGPARAVAAIAAEGNLPELPALEAVNWQGTLALSRRNSRLAGRRLLVLGDAAGYVEPFTGEGITWALSAASHVTRFLRSGLTAWSRQLELEWEDEFERLVTRRQRWCRRLSALVRSPRLSQMALSLLSLAPDLAQPIIRRINTPSHAPLRSGI